MLVGLAAPSLDGLKALYVTDAGLNWPLLSPTIIVLAAVFYITLEHLFPYDKGQKLFRKGWFTDFFWYTLVQSYVLGLVINLFIQFIDTQSGLSRVQAIRSLPLWAQILIFFVVHDFYIYWFHRAQHRFPILWRLHEAHHSVKDVDWLAGSRSHPLEIVINQTIEFLPIVLFASPEVALIKGTIDAVWGMFIHSNINVRAGVIQVVLNGPEMHRWHHSKEYVGYGFNYGTKLAIWDYLFGTVHRPNEKPPGYGLSEDFPEGYFRQVAYAFRPLNEHTSTGDSVESKAS